MTLYHYCSTRAFHSIVETRSLWLSSLSQSSDYMEGKLVAKAIERLAVSGNLAPAIAKQIQDKMVLIENVFGSLGFCLSAEGDLLSQWRGYAADATGVAIGFNKDYLEWLAEASRSEKQGGFRLKKVEYNLSAHDALVEPTYLEVKRLISVGAFKTLGPQGLVDIRTDEEIELDNKGIRNATTNALLTLAILVPTLYLLKSSAFREEHEWRLTSLLVDTETGSCSHRSVDDQLVPFRVYELREMERGPVSEVILGPKHATPVRVVQNFLKQSGFGEVKVIRSEATYR